MSFTSSVQLEEGLLLFQEPRRRLVTLRKSVAETASLRQNSKHASDSEAWCVCVWCQRASHRVNSQMAPMTCFLASSRMPFAGERAPVTIVNACPERRRNDRCVCPVGSPNLWPTPMFLTCPSRLLLSKQQLVGACLPGQARWPGVCADPGDVGSPRP